LLCSRILRAGLLISIGVVSAGCGNAQQTDSTGDAAIEATSLLDSLPDAPSIAATPMPAHPAPMTPRQRFGYATENAFGPLSLVFAAAGAGVNQAQNLYPEFRQGATGYSRYTWHSFSDQAADAYFAGYILPAILHQDPRYYPQSKGSFGERAGYAFSRLLITRSDFGAREFNFSQVLGSGMAASASSLYYPERDRTASLVMQRWVSNLAGDGLLLVLREFTPEISKAFRPHRKQPGGDEMPPQR